MEPYENLCDLTVLEQFKSSLPAQLATYITEKKVKTAVAAAVLADEYVLTHGSGSVGGQGQKEEQWRESFRFRPNRPPVAHEGSYAAVGHVPGTDGKFDPGRTCHAFKNEGTGKGSVHLVKLVRYQQVPVCM